MTNRFADKVVVVTGGTTGIGYASVEKFAAEGAKVVATGTNPETLSKARESLGSDAVEFVSSDAADPTSVEQLFEHVNQKYGRVDTLFLNAGIVALAPLAEADEKQYDDLFTINVKGPWLAIKNATPLLTKGASIIATTSVVNQRPFEGAGLYSATKAGLRGLLRSASVELASQAVRVNAIAPGPIDTPILGKMVGAEALDETKTNLASLTTLGRIGTSAEVADAVTFLASDEASYINGVELNVDGGFVF